MSGYEDHWNDPLPPKVEADLAFARAEEAVAGWDEPLPSEVEPEAGG